MLIAHRFTFIFGGKIFEKLILELLVENLERLTRSLQVIYGEFVQKLALLLNNDVIVKV